MTEVMQGERLANLHLDLLNKSRLTWDVLQEPLVSTSGKLTKEVGAFRSDNGYHLGTHSERYQVCQNSELAKLLVYSASEIDGLSVEDMRGGMLSNGKKVYFQIPLPSKTINDSEVNSYITALNSHDGTTGVAFGTTQVVVICQNTFYLGYRSPDMARVLHHSTMKERLESISEAMLMSIRFDKEVASLFERMSEIEVTSGIVKSLETKLFPISDDKQESTRRKNIVSKFNESLEIEFSTQGTNLWGLFNGVTRYTNHNMTTRKETDKQSNIMIGQGAKINTAAFQHITSKFSKELIVN